MSNTDLKLDFLKGKVIAIVYIFEKENAAGFKHFLTWKEEILTGWLNAVYEINCLPYIIDVRTFIQKASNYSLPHIDFVINLNSGCYELSTMGLVPSICSFLKIPCIPCNAVSILTAENKRISNYIARGFNLSIPEFLNKTNRKGIYRPVNLGNSMGVETGNFKNLDKDGIYQEFIYGYDVTIPIAYNFCLKEMDILPPIVYLPDTLDPNWIYNETAKKDDKGFVTAPVLNISDLTKKRLIEFIKIFDIKTYGRIDARIKCTDSKLSKDIVDKPLDLNNLYFIEINSMPTIETDDGFDLAFKVVLSSKEHSFYICAKAYTEYFKNPTINGFLLACAIMALSDDVDS
ncbi:MAG: hypothetical protein LUH47_08540 [Clostridiales bacterium]|nr:hypothetical protein [Clostridiales bacterium]